MIGARRTRRQAAMVLAGVVAAGCGPGDGPAAEGAGFAVRDSAGIEIVESLGSVWAPGEAWTIDPDPVLQIGAVEGDDPYLFTSISQATLLPDGSIAVVQRRFGEVRIFGPDGVHRTTFGRKGDGPGEFSNGPFLAEVTSDTLLAWDDAHRRLSWFLTDGTLLRDESLLAALADAEIQAVGGGGGWSVRGDGAVFYNSVEVQRAMEGTGGQWAHPLLILDRGARIARFGRYPTGQSFGIRFPNGGGIAVSDPFAPSARGIPGRSGYAAAVGDPEDWELRLFGEDEQVRRVIRAEVPVTPITEAMRADAIQSTLDTWGSSGLTEGELRRALDQFPQPDHLPPMGSLRWDRAGHIWVGRRGVERLRLEALHDVFDPEGRWLGTVEIPEAIATILEIGDDYVLAPWRDEFNVPYLRIYRLVKGDG